MIQCQIVMNIHSTTSGAVKCKPYIIPKPDAVIVVPEKRLDAHNC